MSDTAPVSDSGPLSFQQEEMIGRLRAFPECAGRDHLVWLFELRGSLSVDHLVAAFDDVVDRHAALRTTIGNRGGHDIQRVHSGRLHDVVVRTGVACHDLVAELIDGRYTTEDVLAGRPLFHVQIVTVDDTSHLLAVRWHHLLCDSLSVFVVWQDVAELYNARVEGRQANLPAPGGSYVQYARDQRSHWIAYSRRAVSYWREVTQGAPQTVRWPPPATPAGTYETAVQSFSVPADLVRRHARTARVTPFLVLLAASSTALARIAGGDVLVGTDFANREERNTRGMVGHLLNTRLTRATWNGQSDFRELVLATRARWLAAEEQRDAYMDQVLQQLGIPWLPSVLSDPGDLLVHPELSGVTVRRVAVEPNDPYWREFILTWRSDGGQHHGEILYRPSRVDVATIHDIVGAVIEILAAE